MVRIVSDEAVGRYYLLKIEGEKPRMYTHYKIGNELFKPVPVHNMSGYIAIESDKSHKGETVEFIVVEE